MTTFHAEVEYIGEEMDGDLQVTAIHRLSLHALTWIELCDYLKQYADYIILRVIIRSIET